MTHSRFPAGTTRRWAVAVGLIGTFLLTRCVSALFLNLDEVRFVANDVSYYGFHLFRLDEGESGVMVEYPLPAVWILQAIYRLGGGWQTWGALYVAVFVLLDALVAMTLYRRDNAAGALFWILFTAAQGPILWYRFDLIPAALVAWACLFVTRFPRLAGGMVGMGAAIKLWPALLIGPMLAPHPWRSARARGRATGFLVVGLGLAAASLLNAGWARSASPVTWQSQRGLQIESVPASPLMLLRTFTDNPSWNIFLSQFNALELQGPFVEELLRASTVLTALSLATAAYLSYRLIRHLHDDDERLHEAILLAILTIVLATIVTNKTLSPQYIAWLGGPVAALLVARRSAWLRRPLIVFAVALVIVAVLTQMTYPWGAYGIMAIPLGSGPETSILLLRNLTLVCLTAYAFALTLKASRPLAPGSSQPAHVPQLLVGAAPTLVDVGKVSGQKQPQSSAAEPDSQRGSWPPPLTHVST